MKDGTPSPSAQGASRDCKHDWRRIYSETWDGGAFGQSIYLCRECRAVKSGEYMGSDDPHR